jgi:hypothetical protein
MSSGALAATMGATKQLTGGKGKKAAKNAPSPKIRYDRLKNQIQKAAAQSKEGIAETLFLAEMDGALALSAFSAGYFGPAKMRPFMKNSPIGDVRFLSGVAATGYGLMQAFDGSMKHGMAGNHALALGNGLLASILYETAHNAGVDLAVKRSPTLKAQEGTRSRIQGRRPVMVAGGHSDYDETLQQSAVGARLARR